MNQILKNKNLEAHIELPNENYSFSRFDWTGKIVKMKFQGITVSGTESTGSEDENIYGKGFYNEFGIDTALGFEETDIGGWFHKIGIGLLKKEDNQYLFNKEFEIRPAKFKTTVERNRIIITCKSESVGRYSYLLRKEIELHENNLLINYYLKNTGEKYITTSEYVHNFIAINQDLIGTNYIIKFPFQLEPELFSDAVNPEEKVSFRQNEIIFEGCPNQQFFFSNLSGNKEVDAKWELINLESGIGITEKGSFQTDKVNLWGWKHVVSPELFINLNIKPGLSTRWSRTYHVYRINDIL